MTIAAVVNTCCMKPHAGAGQSGVPYANRRAWLHDLILPKLASQGFDPIVVVGTFEPGNGYEYIPLQDTYGNCRDVILQREAGARKALRSQVGHVWFQMDDHLLTYRHPILGLAELDLMSPYRINQGMQEVNTGWNDVGMPDPTGKYLHTHGILMSRLALQKCPWHMVTPIYRFDVVATWFYHDRGLKAMLGGWTIQDLEE